MVEPFAYPSVSLLKRVLARCLLGCLVIMTCTCGKKIIGKYQQDQGCCKACSAKKKAERYAHAAAVVQTGKCPDCGTALERNLALTGWWQCGAYGVPSMRKPEHRSKLACGFQTFTEK